MQIEQGYEPLAAVLEAALNQSQHGKGRERHATTQGVDRPFTEQPICTIARMVGPGYQLGQAMKKCHEAMELPGERAEAEALGAIVYIAAAVLVMREQAEAEKRAAGQVLDESARWAPHSERAEIEQYNVR